MSTTAFYLLCCTLRFSPVSPFRLLGSNNMMDLLVWLADRRDAVPLRLTKLTLFGMGKAPLSGTIWQGC
jgi:hypothetical protein